MDEETAKFLKSYEIPPNDEKLPSYPLKKYFLKYAPQWSHIYSHYIPKTTNYEKIADGIACGKNIVVTGNRALGKTTLMMQLLVDYETTRLKHTVNSNVRFKPVDITGLSVA